MRAMLAAAVMLAAAAPRAAAASAGFAVDARVELASVVLMLAEPAEFRARRPDGLDAYAAAAEAAFAAHAAHPAVARVRDLRRGGAPASALVRAALSPSRGDPLAAELVDFEKASGFAAFFASRGEDHRAFVETARRESLHAISPESALAYMGVAMKGDRRFLLAPLLPDDEGLAELSVRAGTPAGRGTRFRFDDFERSVAAELCREAAGWIREPAGSIPAHLAAAVGLRVIARDLGERAYRAALARLESERLPHLRPLAERLKEFEGERVRHETLRAFAPRLEALAAIRVEQAAAAARAGGRDAALSLLAEARAFSPDVETTRRMIFLYQDLKEDARARELSDEILAAGSRQPGLLLDRAGLAAKAGDRAAALGLLDEARGKEPDEAARRRMTELYLELNEFGPARDLLDGLIAAAPHEPRLRIDRALAAARTGDRAAALRGLADAAARRPDPGAARRMALLHLELGDAGPARDLIDRLVKASPKDPLLHVDRAAVAAADGDRERALRELAEARALSPALETRKRIAFLYQDLKDDASAVELLHEIQKDSPPSARLEIDRATRAARAGDRETALQRLAEARALNPSFDERRLMVSLHQGLDDPGPARSLLAGLMAAAPRDPGLRIDHADLSARTGDGPAALASLAQARGLDPDPAGRRRMALIHQDLKDYAGALALLEPLAREQPANAALLADLGLCRYLGGGADAAIEDLRAALELDPAALPAVLTLGSIYAARGRLDLELALYDATPSAGGEPALRALLRARHDELLRARLPRKE
ncbi:MAG: tetratricopeptide repeat protein [Elusimicrobia bacterium]|nr:tetratricopeptide repeat protein [Elusimicrobiota bacterium]